MPGRAVILGIIVAGAAQAQEIPQFEPREFPHHVYGGGWEHFVGGGASGFDCNGDGFLDLFLAGGENPAQLLKNTTAAVGESIVFEKADLPQLVGVTGAYPLDIDADGHIDLAVLRVGPDVLLNGQGDCSFTPFDDALGFQSGDHWTTAFSATWEEDQSLPTLAFGTYVDRANPNGPFEACDTTLLYRPSGQGYPTPQKLDPGYCALSMLFTDWSRSGRQDLRVSNDRHYYVRGGQEQLWAMQDTPRLYGEADGWADYQLWGMGIASRDLNGDGYSEVFLTSMGDQKLQFFDPEAGGPAYVNAPFATGTSAHRPYYGDDGRPSTGWHAVFGDFQNDGLDDIYVAKGNVDQMPDAAMQDPNNLLVQRPGGGFFEAGAEAGLASMERSRGSVVADLNNDGRLDLVVLNRRASAELYENRSASGNWLSVSLQLDGLNRAGVGYFVEVSAGDRTHTREVTIGGGHAGGVLGGHHFGLGDADKVDLRIIRADQSASEWTTVPVNVQVVLRGDGSDVAVD